VNTNRWAVLGAVVSVALVVLVNARMASAATIPVLWTDEVGYLANAQILAGVGEPRDLAGRSYYVGWSILLAPLWWMTNDLELIYRFSVVLSAIFGIALVWPLALIARRFALSWPWSIVVASVVAVAPSHAVMSTFALSENLVTFLLAFTVVAALRFQRRATPWSAVLLGLSAAAVFIAHGRMIPVLIAAALHLLVSIRAHARASIIGLIALGVTAAGGFLVYRAVTALMYAASLDREASALERIFGSSPGAVATAAAGQVWYELVAWGGVTVLGGILISRAALREIRARRPGAATFGLIALAGAIAVSSTWLARVIDAGRERLDVLAYGRYLEPYGVVLAMLGIILILRRPSVRVVWVAVGTALATSAVFAAFVAPQARLDGVRFWGPTGVPGMLQWPWPHVTAAQGPPWLLAGSAALVVLALVILLRRWRAVVVGGLLAVFAVSSILAKENTLDPYFATFRGAFTLRTELAQYPDATLAFDLAGTAGDTVSRNAYQYWGAVRPVDVFDSRTADVPNVDFVIARRDWPVADEEGARKLADDAGFDNAIWVLPGPLMRQLELSGDLR